MDLHLSGILAIDDHLAVHIAHGQMGNDAVQAFGQGGLTRAGGAAQKDKLPHVDIKSLLDHRGLFRFRIDKTQVTYLYNRFLFHGYTS